MKRWSSAVFFSKAFTKRLTGISAWLQMLSSNLIHRYKPSILYASTMGYFLQTWNNEKNPLFDPPCLLDSRSPFVYKLSITSEPSHSGGDLGKVYSWLKTLSHAITIFMFFGVIISDLRVSKYYLCLVLLYLTSILFSFSILFTKSK